MSLYNGLNTSFGADFNKKEPIWWENDFFKNICFHTLIQPLLQDEIKFNQIKEQTYDIIHTLLGVNQKLWAQVTIKPDDIFLAWSEFQIDDLLKEKDPSQRLIEKLLLVTYVLAMKKIEELLFRWQLVNQDEQDQYKVDWQELYDWGLLDHWPQTNISALEQ